jgi:hypothetical protein
MSTKRRFLVLAGHPGDAAIKFRLPDLRTQTLNAQRLTLIVQGNTSALSVKRSVLSVLHPDPTGGRQPPVALLNPDFWSLQGCAGAPSSPLLPFDGS